MLGYKSMYKNDHQENIRIFSDLKAEKEFSIYANDLNHIFGDNSYHQFHKNLTEPKQVVAEKFTDIFHKSNKKKDKYKIFEEQFNLKQFEESLTNMKLKDKILNEKLKHPYYERMKQSRNYLLKKEMEKYRNTNKPIKSFFPEVPEVGRYQPKYNSINKHSYRAFFGNVPSNRFNTIGHEINKYNRDSPEKKDENENGNIDNNNNNINHKLIINNNLFNKSNNDKQINKHFSLKKLLGDNQKPIKSIQDNNDNNNNKNNNNNDGVLFKQKLYKIRRGNSLKSNNISKISDNNNSFNNSLNNSQRGINNSSIDSEKNSYFNKSMKTRNRSDNNHCLRFETYTSRKPLNKTIIYNTDIRTELPNYYTSKYIKNNIDFNRNKSTLSYLEKLIIKEKNPPLGFYEPKYNYVFNNIDKNIYINKKILPVLTQNKINKIFCDYNISKDYQTVPSLNDNNDENEDNKVNYYHQSKKNNIQ